VDDTIEGNYPEKGEVSAESEERMAEEEEAGTMTTRSGRVVNKPSRFLAVTKISRKDWKDQAVEKAIKEEIRMLFEDLKALRVVRRTSIKAGTKILKSHMFVVAKHLASEEFDKMKARLVADGRDQEQELYPDKSSPTVAIHSVFTVR
jgi:plasmid replication initiation protein